MSAVTDLKAPRKLSETEQQVLQGNLKDALAGVEDAEQELLQYICICVSNMRPIGHITKELSDDFAIDEDVTLIVAKTIAAFFERNGWVTNHSTEKAVAKLSSPSKSPETTQHKNTPSIETPSDPQKKRTTPVSLQPSARLFQTALPVKVDSKTRPSSSPAVADTVSTAATIENSQSGGPAPLTSPKEASVISRSTDVSPKVDDRPPILTKRKRAEMSGAAPAQSPHDALSSDAPSQPTVLSSRGRGFPRRGGFVPGSSDHAAVANDAARGRGAGFAGRGRGGGAFVPRGEGVVSRGGGGMHYRGGGAAFHAAVGGRGRGSNVWTKEMGFSDATAAAPGSRGNSSTVFMNKKLIPCKWGAECYHVSCEFGHPDRAETTTLPKSARFTKPTDPAASATTTTTTDSIATIAT